MKLVNMIETLRTKTVKKIAYGILVLLVMVDFIIPRHEVHFFGDKIPGFWSLFGFSALCSDYNCIQMVRQEWPYEG